MAMNPRIGRNSVVAKLTRKTNQTDPNIDKMATIFEANSYHLFSAIACD